MNIILKVIIAIPLGIFAFVFLVLVRNTFVPRYPYSGTPKDLGIEYQEVEFSASDGANLKGWLILKDKNQPLIILLHGLGASKSDLLDFISFLHRAGYNLFLFDFRAHGESRGWVSSFGYREKRDLEGALDYLKQRGFNRFGVFGISMGASVAIMAASEREEIACLVVDSPYIDLDEAIIFHTKQLLPFPGNFLGRLTVLSYRLRFLTDSSKFSPLKVVSRISPRALLIINGSEDKRMKPEDARRLYEQAGEPRELWLVKGAEHLESYSVAKDEYQKRLDEFFKTHLLKNRIKK